MYIVQWGDGFEHTLEEEFDTRNAAYVAAQSMLMKLRHQYPNQKVVTVRVLQVVSTMTETGVNVAGRL